MLLGHVIPWTRVCDPALVSKYHHLGPLEDLSAVRGARGDGLPRSGLGVDDLASAAAGNSHRHSAGCARQVVVRRIQRNLMGPQDSGHEHEDDSGTCEARPESQDNRDDGHGIGVGRDEKPDTAEPCHERRQSAKVDEWHPGAVIALPRSWIDAVSNVPTMAEIAEVAKRM